MQDNNVSNETQLVTSTDVNNNNTTSNTKKIYTSGRPPWYDQQGKLKNPLVIGVCGGSASGKTSVCHEVIKALNVRWVVLLSMDSFYKPITKDQDPANYNFDHPNAFDYDLMIKTIGDLRQGKRTQIPIYDFKTHSRLARQNTVYGADVIILEGILTLYSKELCELMDIKIFIDTDDDVRLCRRLKRDIAERGRTLTSVIEQYNRFVKPSFDDYILPTKKYADIIVPRGSDNIVAIELLTEHIKGILKERGYVAERSMPIGGITAESLPANIHIMQDTNQIKAMHTILRNKATNVGDFVFYSDRLVMLIIEEALTLLPFKEKVITTPVNQVYKGEQMDCKVAAVSILRAGSCMEHPLRSICKGIKTGKILIQSDENKQPHLFYERLPDLSDSHVLVLDPTIATGASSQMAIRVLLDHGIPEDRIIFVSVIASLKGVMWLNYCFPDIKIVASALDNELSENGYILPGIGNYSDRYFGTGVKQL
ncbi:uridine kinase [Cavenderia fasciculata]|uniref:Uridine-cytidine kinase n=1 Tax=Cavenderia fasciculata TaxID=261658 RepID=F4PZ54_CACFS|nr:uridine kinase [Cavenderia fasciculata]EGG19083.1 uridine kinase [Cavenderia fasciculata]|eukprot:XP_004366716.1 uridine kinase [Cavenderia fasciculata]